MYVILRQFAPGLKLQTLAIVSDQEQLDCQSLYGLASSLFHSARCLHSLPGVFTLCPGSSLSTSGSSLSDQGLHSLPGVFTLYLGVFTLCPGSSLSARGLHSLPRGLHSLTRVFTLPGVFTLPLCPGSSLFHSARGLHSLPGVFTLYPGLHSSTLPGVFTLYPGFSLFLPLCPGSLLSTRGLHSLPGVFTLPLCPGYSLFHSTGGDLRHCPSTAAQDRLCHPHSNDFLQRPVDWRASYAVMESRACLSHSAFPAL
ncbi:unnamed protein product [Gadus morhua 'NCC']